MTHDGKQVHFLLEREWMNYIYTPIGRAVAETFLFHAIVKDMCCGNNAMVLRIITPDRPENGLLFKAECENGKVAYSVADIEKDRLPGHEFATIQGVDEHDDS